MDCRIALRGAMSGHISRKTEKSLKPSDLLDHSNFRYSFCFLGFSVRHARHCDGALQLIVPTFRNM